VPVINDFYERKNHIFYSILGIGLTLFRPLFLSILLAEMNLI
jgi:hypothetical protein